MKPSFLRLALLGCSLQCRLVLPEPLDRGAHDYDVVVPDGTKILSLK